MSLSFGFYNSLNGDRKYNSIQMSQIFDGIINDGIFMSIGSKMMVTANNQMTVAVGTGRAWFNGTWTYIDAPYLITLEKSEVLQNRIDAVVLEINGNLNVRENSIKIVKGTPALNPKKPELIKQNLVYQYPLAYITVNKAVEEIRQDDIENAVGLSSTPFVTGILKTMDIDALVAQWQSQWKTWMKDIDTDMLKWSSGVKEDTSEFQNENKKQWDEWFERIRKDLDSDPIGNLELRVTDLENSENVSYVSLNLLPSKWKIPISTLDGDRFWEYSFEEEYPNVKYDMDLFLGENTTEKEYNAWIDAKIIGNSKLNKIKCLGPKPDIEIPVILKIKTKLSGR